MNTSRMRSAVPKVMHTVCGRPMVAWPVLAARRAGAGRVAVIASPDHDLSAALPHATRASERILSLPLFPAMTDTDVDDVVAAVTEVLARHAA